MRDRGAGGGHQDIHLQMLFYEVAESRAVNELDPIILLGFDPACRRKPLCGDENACVQMMEADVAVHVIKLSVL